MKKNKLICIEDLYNPFSNKISFSTGRIHYEYTPRIKSKRSLPPINYVEVICNEEIFICPKSSFEPINKLEIYKYEKRR